MLSCLSVYDSSDREGALSRSRNDTADSDDVDSGVSPEHVHAQDCPDSQESDVAISFLRFVQGFNYGMGTLRMRNGRMGVSTHYARNYAYANSFPLCLRHTRDLSSEKFVHLNLAAYTMKLSYCYKLPLY